MTTAAAPGADAPPQVTVRYWAGARAAAGVDTEVLSGATVADVLAGRGRPTPAWRRCCRSPPCCSTGARRPRPSG